MVKKIIFVLLACASSKYVNPATILHIINASEKPVTLDIIKKGEATELFSLKATQVIKNANIKIPLADCFFESITKTSEYLSITTKLGTFFCVEGGCVIGFEKIVYATWLQKKKAPSPRQLASSYGFSGLAGSDKDHKTNLQLILKIDKKGTIEATTPIN